jgi:hypothetical protein
MIGLEKTKAKAGEVSQSARALSLEDMHRLYKICFDPNATDAQKRWGAIRFVSTLHPNTHHTQLLIFIAVGLPACILDAPPD